MLCRAFNERLELNEAFDSGAGACAYAAKMYAKEMLSSADFNQDHLLDRRFFLEWEIILKDSDQMTRVFRAKGTDWYVIVDNY